jgi:peptide-methionine (S)-S-oxide reductase
MFPARLTIAAVVASAALAIGASTASAESTRLVAPPAVDEPAAQATTQQATTQTAVLAGGCFWGVQGVFQHVQGVTSAVSGYAGGAKETAEYEKVGSGRTGHAESVRITYDPRQISFGRLLQIYFSVAHDPTELDRQGPDVGPQYRSTIFPTSDEQARIAKAYIDQLNRTGAFSSKVVTTIEPGRPFYAAEGYHQDFLTRHPNHPYIVIHDLPKVAALKSLFPNAYRTEPVLVAKTGLAGGS